MFLFNGHENDSRSLIKAATWRALGSIDIFLPSWFWTGRDPAAEI